MVFGPLGDRVGRQKVLALTMIMMAAGTFAIGLIPSYATIGVGAPLLLLAARLVQGFSTGGEYAGASTFIAEYAPDKQRGFFGSWLEFGTLAGYIGGAGLVTLMTAFLSTEDLLSWGWRVPFLIAGPMGIIGLYLRMRLEETPGVRGGTGEGLQEGGGPPRGCGCATWSRASGARCCSASAWCWSSTSPTTCCCRTCRADPNQPAEVRRDARPAGRPRRDGADDDRPALRGGATDRIGRRPVIAAGCVGFLALSVPALLLIRQGSLLAVALGMGALGLLLVCFTSAMPAALPALFPTKVRYGSLSIGFNVSVSLFGGTTPLVTTACSSGRPGT